MARLIDADALIKMWQHTDAMFNGALHPRIDDVVKSIDKAPTIDINLQELEDRFGTFVREVVEDMISGEGKRWKDDKGRSNINT